MRGLAHVILQNVAGSGRLAKFCLVDGQKKQRTRLFARRQLAKAEHASRLRHAFDDQHPRHHRIFREMADELRFIRGDILDADAIFVAAYSDNPIDQKERIAVGQQPQDFVNVGGAESLFVHSGSGIPASAYQAILKNPAQLHLPAYANGKPEGYLFPATYEVVPHESALGVLSGMVQRFNQEAAQLNLATAAKRVHLTESQVITMASLVEAEGGRTSDYPKIARVIYNRLAQGIPLQLDSTVLYGLNTYGSIASDEQLNSSSPYNTYKLKGLTPGPIDSPGAAAIEAVLHPAGRELAVLRDRRTPRPA